MDGGHLWYCPGLDSFRKGQAKLNAQWNRHLETFWCLWNRALFVWDAVETRGGAINPNGAMLSGRVVNLHSSDARRGEEKKWGVSIKSSCSLAKTKVSVQFFQMFVEAEGWQIFSFSPAGSDKWLGPLGLSYVLPGTINLVVLVQWLEGKKVNKSGVL